MSWFLELRYQKVIVKGHFCFGMQTRFYVFRPFSNRVSFSFLKTFRGLVWEIVIT